MLSFRRFTPEDRELFQKFLPHCAQQGCEYSFVNLNIWGNQQFTLVHDFLVLFSQFDRFSVYPFPLGYGDPKPVLEAIMEDAQKRGISCRISSLTKSNCDLLEQLFPGQFCFHTDRDNYDYVYAIGDLASLSGKRYQSKRNFVNRFRANHPDHALLPLDDTTEAAARQCVDRWFAQRQQTDPLTDFHLEKKAIGRAFAHRKELGIEGLVLMEGGEALAVTMGSPLSESTFDIHFEKALDGVDGAYAAINQGFARYLQETYPQLQYLNREDDLGIPGLRQAKLSYYPDHLVEKHWAKLREDDDED